MPAKVYKYGTYGEVAPSIAKLSRTGADVIVYFGTAPVGQVRGKTTAELVNTPIKISTLAEAKALVGYTRDYGNYTLCEAIGAHFDSTHDPIGPIYVINCLDPAKHRGESRTAALTVANDRATIPGAGTVLDSIRLLRPVQEGVAQQVTFRPNGTSAGDKGFDYAAAYGKAGVKLQDAVITYEPTGEIDPKLIHDGKLYVGLQFTKPDGATNATIKCNGAVVDELDLAKDGEFVCNGQVIEYIAVADEDGTPLADRALNFECDWTGGETEQTVCMVSTGDGRFYTEDVEYTLAYNDGTESTVIASLDGALPASVQAQWDVLDPTKVTEDEIVGAKTENGEYSGIHAIDLVFMVHGAIPNILAAPGWSHKPRIYKALCNAARKASGHWDSVVFADFPLEDEEVIDSIPKAIEWKAENKYTDERSKVFWPMAVDDQGRIMHLSSLAAAEALRIDMTHDGVPMETCGNKDVPIVRQYFGETSPNRGFDQTDGNKLTEKGISTVTPWARHWVLWGDSTAAFEFGDEELDARAIFDTTIRMLLHVTNDFQREWAPYIDKPMTRQLVDQIINRELEKMDALKSMGAVLGDSTVEFNQEDNTNDDVLQGRFTWQIRTTPTVPLKSATVVVAYTDTGFATLFEEA